MLDKIIASVITVGFWLWLGLDIHKQDKKHGIDSWFTATYFGVVFGGLMLAIIWLV